MAPGSVLPASTLTRGCPGCGASSEPGARFCSSCGASLVEAVTLPPVAPSEERRIISDLVGFTDHTERTDPEDSRRRLSSKPKRVPDTEAFVRSQEARKLPVLC